MDAQLHYLLHITYQELAARDCEGGSMCGDAGEDSRNQEVSILDALGRSTARVVKTLGQILLPLQSKPATRAVSQTWMQLVTTEISHDVV